MSSCRRAQGERQLGMCGLWSSYTKQSHTPECCAGPWGFCVGIALCKAVVVAKRKQQVEEGRKQLPLFLTPTRDQVLLVGEFANPLIFLLCVACPRKPHNVGVTVTCVVNRRSAESTHVPENMAARSLLDNLASAVNVAASSADTNPPAAQGWAAFLPCGTPGGLTAPLGAVLLGASGLSWLRGKGVGGRERDRENVTAARQGVQPR